MTYTPNFTNTEQGTTIPLMPGGHRQIRADRTRVTCV